MGQSIAWPRPENMSSRIFHLSIVIGFLLFSYVLFMPFMYSFTLGVTVAEAATDLISHPLGFIQGGETLTPAAFLSAILGGVSVWIVTSVIWLFWPEWRVMPAPGRGEGRPRRVRDSAGIAALCSTFSIIFCFVGIYFLRGEFGRAVAPRWFVSTALFVASLVMSWLTAQILFGRVGSSESVKT
jgi:hypothetical protein